MGQCPFTSCPRSLSSRKQGAGIHTASAMEKVFDWIPASAGMTDFSASDGKLAHYRSPRLSCICRTLIGHNKRFTGGGHSDRKQCDLGGTV